MRLYRDRPRAWLYLRFVRDIHYSDCERARTHARMSTRPWIFAAIVLRIPLLQPDIYGSPEKHRAISPRFQ